MLTDEDIYCSCFHIAWCFTYHYCDYIYNYKMNNLCIWTFGLQTFSNVNNFWSLWKIYGRHIFHISECCIINIIEDVRKHRMYVGSRRFYIKNLYVKFCQRLIATEFRSKLSNTGSILMVFLYEKVLCNNFRSCVDSLANRQLSIRISSFWSNGVNRCDI